MGMFVNPDNSAFQAALNAQIYVDKSSLLVYTIVFWHLQTHLYATAAHVDLENQSQLICLQRITVKAVIQVKCLKN